MANSAYQSSYTGAEIDAAIAKAVKALVNDAANTISSPSAYQLNLKHTGNKNAVGIRFYINNVLAGGLYVSNAGKLFFDDSTQELLNRGNFIAGTDYQEPIPSNTYAPYDANGYLSKAGGSIGATNVCSPSSLNPFNVYGRNGAYIGFGIATSAAAGTRYGMIAMTAADGNLLRVKNNYTSYMIHDDGNYSGGGGSDIRLKENVETLNEEESKAILGKLRPVEFDWNEKAKEIDKRKIEKSHDVGFIAQEVMELIPSSVTKDYAKDYLRLDTAKIVSYLVKGWQAQEREIEQLKSENAELKKQIAEIKESIKKML